MRPKVLALVTLALAVSLTVGIYVRTLSPAAIRRAKAGQVQAARIQIAQLETAIANFRADHQGEVPEDLHDLIAVPTDSDGKRDSRWKGPYLLDVNSVPMDPWGNPYSYNVPGPLNQPYEILS